MSEEKESAWLKIISVEVMASVLVMAFTVGGTYMAIAKDIKGAEQKTNTNEKKLIDLDKDVQTIKVDVAVTKNKTENIEKELEKVNSSLNEIRRLIVSGQAR